MFAFQVFFFAVLEAFFLVDWRWLNRFFQGWGWTPMDSCFFLKFHVRIYIDMIQKEGRWNVNGTCEVGLDPAFIRVLCMAREEFWRFSRCVSNEHLCNTYSYMPLELKWPLFWLESFFGKAQTPKYRTNEFQVFTTSYTLPRVQYHFRIAHSKTQIHFCCGALSWIRVN